MKKKCSVEHCCNPARARGLCKLHHFRWRKHGDATTLLKRRTITHPNGGDGCSVEGCDGDFHCHGFCYKHYARWKRHGDPLHNKTEERLSFIAEAMRYSGDECLVWPFKTLAGQGGYPVATINGERQYVHRYVCERANGPAPSMTHLALHSCDKPACITSRHLRWGTVADNTADMIARGRGVNNMGRYPPNDYLGLQHKVRRLHLNTIWRDTVLERDKYICQKCGEPADIAHHLTPLARLLQDHGITTVAQAKTCEALWDTGNGSARCLPCHSLIHRGEAGRTSYW